MGRIFISYAREDRAFAERLACVIENDGHDVWWDKRLEGGEEFGAEIEAALAQAEVVLVAWSEKSVKSRWVRDEAGIAGDTGRLMPLSIDGSQPPIGFKQFHTLDLSGWRGGKRDERTADLLQSIRRRLSGKLIDQGTRSKASSAGSLPAVVTTRSVWILVSVVMLVVAVVGYFVIAGGKGAAEQQTLTIALFRFSTTSPDSQLRDLAAQATDSLSHTLPQSGIAVRLFNEPPTDIREAGNFVISGELSKKNADKFTATVRMDDVAHRVTVFTRQFEASGDEASQLPDRIGAQVAGTIAWAAPLIELEIRHPSDPSVMADLMRQLDMLGDPLTGYQAAQRAAARDPTSAFAQIALAFDTAFNLSQLPLNERASAVAQARAAAARAVKLAPEFGDAYSVTCYLHSETLLRDCEDRLRQARRIDPDSPFADAFLSALLRTVGRFEESYKLAQLSYARDPYVPTKIGWMLRSFESSGRQTAAEELYQQGLRWWPEFSGNYFENRLLPLLEHGNWKAIRRLEQNTAPNQRPSHYGDSAALYAAIKARSADAANNACHDNDDYWLKIRCLVGFAIIGDLNRAFALAEKLYPNRIGSTAEETERIWLEAADPVAPLELLSSPAVAPMRRDQRYLQLAHRIGLLAYWRSGRAPDFCRPNPEPICRQLLKRT